MIYLYGVTDTPASELTHLLEGRQGLEGPVQVSTIAGVSLVFSPHVTEDILPKRRLMLCHTRLLETLMTCGTVLPARFGLVAQELETAEHLIEDQAETLRGLLQRMAGHVELGVRVSFPRPAAIAATLAASPALLARHKTLQDRGPGAQFEIAAFGGQLAEALDRDRAAAQKALLAHLIPLAADHVLKAPDADTQVLRAEFLVPQTRQEAFLETLTNAVATLRFAPGAEPEIEVVGPAPLYHFVNLDLSSALAGQAA